MVLVREIAVEGWREEIGPTDPEIARLEAPNSYVNLWLKEFIEVY